MATKKTGSSTTKKSTSKKSTSKKEVSLTTQIKKDIKKDIKKTTKKHPVAVFIIVLIIIALLAGTGVVLWKTGVLDGLLAPRDPDSSESSSSHEHDHTNKIILNGAQVVSIQIGGTYTEEGATLTYNNEDKSSEITIKYYKEDMVSEISTIPTDTDAVFYAVYSVSYADVEDVKRTINVGTASIYINFLELGNKFTGDSTYIKAGDVDILIDAGSRTNSSSTIKNYINTHGCTDGKLEYVIATHAHQDHIAAFAGDKSNKSLLDEFEVDTIIQFSGHNTTSAVYKNFAAKVEEKKASGTKVYTAKDCVLEENGASKIFNIAPGIQMEVLNQKYYTEKTGDENDYSVCVMFTQTNSTYSSHYLFTGDLEKGGEASLVEMNPDLPQVELFKGGHHGSYTANTDTLLNKIKPKTICICCCAGSDEYTSTNANMFPAQASIDRMAKWTDQIFVTTVDDGAGGYKSMNGNIVFFSLRGSEYTVTGSNNSIILKESDWFKANRTWPTY